MLKERRKLEDLYVGDFIYYQGEVCIIIEKSITNSSIRVLSQKGCTYLIVNNDIDIEKIIQLFQKKRFYYCVNM